MRSARRWSILILLLVAGGVLTFPGPASSQGPAGGINKKSHNKRDHVDITKITPRVAADLPTPAKMPFALEVSYRLVTTPTGKLRVGVFRWKPGTATRRPAAGKLAPGLEALIKPVERPIKAGLNVVTVTTPPVVLHPPKGINSQVIVVVNVQDAKGKEVCWATSYNFLRGDLSVRPDTAPAKGDTLQVVSLSPPGPSLKTGHAYPFSVNLQYSLKSQPWGYVNVEIGEGTMDSWAPWYTAVVPVARGTGYLRVKSKDLFLPTLMAGRELRMFLPFRVQPLGGTATVLTGGPWKLAPQGN